MSTILSYKELEEDRNWYKRIVKEEICLLYKLYFDKEERAEPFDLNLWLKYLNEVALKIAKHEKIC